MPSFETNIFKKIKFLFKKYFIGQLLVPKERIERAKINMDLYL